MSPKISIKQILLSNGNWSNFYEKHKNNLRSSIVIAIVKLLSCKNIVRGYHEYHCSNPNCSHIKIVCHTCKSKACSSCGKKATEIWVQQQNKILPKTSWQHITFTMPCELWDFFWCNRELLDHIGKIAADCIKNMASKKGLIPGIFIAIHTFGRDLKRNVHIHLSVTLGGITPDGNQWKKLFFHQETLMKAWRYAILQLFRHSEKPLIIPPDLKTQLSHAFTFNNFLDQLYQKRWIVHCSAPTDDHKKNVNYLGRYIKRPAIAESKLTHYDGHEVTFNYLNHTTNTHEKLKISAEDFIKRFIQHIPDIGFRMIRYYGFLAHRLRGKLLPLVHQLLGQNKTQATSVSSYSDLIKKNFGFDPLQCILCGKEMVLVAVKFGKTTLAELFKFHRELALLKKI